MQQIKGKVEEILRYVQKPGRYVGGELNSIVKDKSKIDVRFAFCFPDNYEIGMSHLGMKILYGLKNRRDDIWCERVFAPWPDMEEQMRKNGIPLYGLESFDPIKDFDFIGFTLQYELSYTNVLNMLDLADIPVRSCDRNDGFPIVVAGGPCACNPEPLADFIDIFILGEGEEVNLELIDLYKSAKKRGIDKRSFLIEASKLRGIYVPSLYNVLYNSDGTIAEIEPLFGAPSKITKRIISDLDSVYYPEDVVVPTVEIVHDRAVLEIMRGCIRGCRFCQAGYIYRPLREKSSEKLDNVARGLCDKTGYEEISLSSLSTSDYSELEDLLMRLLDWSVDDKVNLSLPSLRIDNFSKELMEKISSVRKSGLTFAPEAGTQRLRDVINKNVTEEEIMNTCKIAFEGGYTSVKLYFMLGLPTETKDDLEGIAILAQKIVDLFYKLPSKPKGKGVNVSISVSTFVPKPFTPFQFEPQDDFETIVEKQKYIMSCIKSKKITYKYHESKTSTLEAVLARGDRRLGNVIYDAWQSGCRFDSWGEYFDFDIWKKAIEKNGLTVEFYANRKREFNETLPWSHIDFGICPEFLISENIKAHKGVTTPNCREKCSGCGVSALKGGKCFG